MQGVSADAHGIGGDALTMERDGARHVPSSLGAETMRLVIDALAALPSDRAGLRLTGIAALRPPLAASGQIGSLAASVIGPACRPVRAILFDKTPTANWALGWHQDRTITVRERIEVEGFGPWTVKAGLAHVAPPFSLVAGMVTLRAHLDPVTHENAPLLIAPGSHRHGLVPEHAVPGVVRACGTIACHAEAGDVWLYATPILHASQAAIAPRRRRVLQVDYAVGDLPGGLAWLGV